MGEPGLLALAYPNGLFRDDKELVELVREQGEDKGKPVNLQLQGRIRTKPQEDHASMGKLQPEHQLAKIPVISNKNALLLFRQRKDFLIGETMGIVTTDPGDIMAELFEEG
jgi:hypothetical protein